MDSRWLAAEKNFFPLTVRPLTNAEPLLRALDMLSRRAVWPARGLPAALALAEVLSLWPVGRENAAPTAESHDPAVSAACAP